METVDLILTARWLVPIEPDHVVLDHHAVVINSGRIIDLMPAAQAAQKYKATARQTFPHHVLLPGLINAHTHAAMTLMRGMADDLPLMTWLNEHIWPTEAKWVNPDYVADGTRLALAEMIRGGTTCFNDMYFFPETVAEVVRETGLRAVLGLIVIDFPSAYGRDADDYLTKGLALYNATRDEPLLDCALAPHAPYTVSAAPLQRIAELSEHYDLPVHIHVHETAAEVEQCLAQNNCRPLAHLDRLGLLSSRLAAVHMTQLLDEEIAQVAAAGASVLHCPESNLKLASGFCPTARLAAAGVNIAIGTDGAASNNDLNLFGELRSAALIAKAVAEDAAALPAHDVLRMATLNGAQALGLGHEIGSLEIGKSADIIAVDLSQPETQPMYNPISHLVYAVGRHQVSDVWVAGRQLLSNRELTTLDHTAVVHEAQQWQQKIGN